ncbi:MAG: ATP-binding protein [Polyangiaceae bacterium]|nr:ATP-binding protein [Polyangiaceae bacterium]
MPRPVPRPELREAVRRSLRRAPVTLLVGPRQCGKTTLARSISESTPSHYFDLEDPESPLRPEVAKQVLSPLRGLIVVDEAQRQPSLFELLRVLADRSPVRARFLLLGSASPSLVKGVSESLAGRVATHEMGGLAITEVGAKFQAELWRRGGFPRSLLARTERESRAWRSDFVATFLERDIPLLGLRVPAPALRRFWTMMAHYHGQTSNLAELARSMGTGENAVRHYLDILTGSFMVRQLPPWFTNVGKRLVKAPKLYVRDSGILHFLLGVETQLGLYAHPKLGASWEGFAIEQIIQTLGAEREAHFYRTHAGAELDLMIERRGKRFGFELKHTDHVTVSKSMRVALDDLGLEHLWVVHPGQRSFALQPRISALPLADLGELARDRRLAKR